MRRVDRGPWPLDDKNPEERKRFHPNKKYQEAKDDLLARLGDYCSYCERKGDLHVEHVIPRNHWEDLAGEWTNFLLGCQNCNGTKKDRNRTATSGLMKGKVCWIFRGTLLPSIESTRRGGIPGQCLNLDQLVFDKLLEGAPQLEIGKACHGNQHR